MNKFFKRFVRQRRDERGNTFVFYMLLVFPVAFICFALGTDVAIAVYTKTTLQADLDAAAQSAVGQSLPNANTATNSNIVRNAFVQVYAADRENGNEVKNTPFVLCQGSEIPFATGGSAPSNYTPANGCGWHQNNYQFRLSYVEPADGKTYRNYVTITVTEYSKTMFLSVIGIDHFTYQLTTTAHLAQSYYNR